MHPEFIQCPGDLQFIVNRQGNARSLRTVAQGSVKNQYCFSVLSAAKIRTRILGEFVNPFFQPLLIIGLIRLKIFCIFAGNLSNRFLEDAFPFACNAAEKIKHCNLFSGVMLFLQTNHQALTSSLPVGQYRR